MAASGTPLNILCASVAVAALAATCAQAQAPPLDPQLSGLAFLTGRWTGGRGQVADTGDSSTGASVITIEANGGALLRRDHTELFDKGGKSKGGFDQVMLIYPDDGSLKADYSDGVHVIHYTRATVTAGRAVRFESETRPGAPTYRLSYDLVSPDALKVDFTMAAPGGVDFRPVATGTLRRAP